MAGHHPEARLPFLLRRTKACLGFLLLRRALVFLLLIFLDGFHVGCALGRISCPLVFPERMVFPIILQAACRWATSAWLAYCYSLLG